MTAQANTAQTQPVGKWQAAGLVLVAGMTPYLRRFVYIRRPAADKSGNPYGGLLWTLPKGRIDSGESISETAVRETFEETGIRARLVPASYLGCFEGSMSRTHYLCGTFGRMEAQPGWETAEVRCVSVKRAIRLFRAIGNHRDANVLERYRHRLG